MITTRTSVVDTLHEKFSVTGMEEDDGFYITIAASDGKYCVCVCVCVWEELCKDTLFTLHR